MQRHIGLDFGTSQTKACIYDLENDAHEFYWFDDADSFFLPSRIYHYDDDTFRYGCPLKDKTAIAEYSYFKIAAAEDDEFVSTTFESKPAKTYVADLEFGKFTPSLLAVLYVARVLMSIKQTYRLKAQPKKAKGLLGRLRGNNTPVEVTFTVRMGIPTEWSHERNRHRKRRFESILYIAHELQGLYPDAKAFEAQNVTSLIEQVRTVWETQCQHLTEPAFLKVADDKGFSVYPETAAGLTFIIETKQLAEGYYGILDIGGGSSDISFFHIHRKKLRYLSSESYFIASNNVYAYYAASRGIPLAQAELQLRDYLAQAEAGTLPESEEHDAQADEIATALRAICREISRITKKQYSMMRRERPGNFFNKVYAGKELIVYGGGAFLPDIRDGEVEVFDNGNRSGFSASLVTAMHKVPVSNYIPTTNLLPEKRWEEHFPLLVVALGLSSPRPQSMAAWFDPTDYVNPKAAPSLIAHPFNQDCYIMNVLEE